jgi:hypothetical protein
VGDFAIIMQSDYANEGGDLQMEMEATKVK